MKVGFILKDVELTVFMCLQEGGGAARTIPRCGEAEGGAIVPGKLFQPGH